jgi:hypothetical protein
LLVIPDAERSEGDPESRRWMDSGFALMRAPE